jgi:hypothetical protein
VDEQALYEAIAPELEHTDEAHARDIIRIVRAVLLARDRELARELRLHPERHHSPMRRPYRSASTLDEELRGP